MAASGSTTERVRARCCAANALRNPPSRTVAVVGLGYVGVRREAAPVGRRDRHAVAEAAQVLELAPIGVRDEREQALFGRRPGSVLRRRAAARGRAASATAIAGATERIRRRYPVGRRPIAGRLGPAGLSA